MQATPLRNPNRWRRIEEVFHEACEREPARRPAFLEEACGTDAELRAEVETLLAAVEGADPELATAIQQAAQACLGERPPEMAAEGECMNQYRILRKLGAGGMGEVYLGEDMRLKRKVALKVLAASSTVNAAALHRFEREAQLLSALNHANLLTVYDFCEARGKHVLVTEYVEGETLRQVLSRGRVATGQAVDIMAQVANALSAAHTSGVVHRDVKPENIMVRPDGGVKVLDFGIAKLMEQPTSPDLYATTGMPTALGAILGTPRYMSPEQARGSAVDARTDLFSFGAVFYEILTGRPAFNGDTQSDVLAEVLRSDPPPMKRFLGSEGRVLQPIVSRALEKDRERRYGSAQDLVADLQHYRSEAEFKQRLLGGKRKWLAAAVLVMLVAVAAAFLLVRQGAPHAPAAAPRSLAVLPFRNLRPGPDADFLGVSLAGEVAAKLSYVKALVVRPASSTSRYRGGVQDLEKTARDLNAEMLLTGTYQKEGAVLRIAAQLIGFHPRQAVLWQDTWQVKDNELRRVPDSVAQMMIRGLELRLAPDEQARLTHDAAVDRLAYEYYLRGVDLYSVSNFPAAIAMLERSASIDANYAPTWAHLGRAYTTNASLQFGGREDYRGAEAAYEKAIALDPTFPEPRIYMANLLTDTGRVEQAVPLLRGALDSSPNDAEAHWELGYAYRFGGLLAESVKESELARRLDPEVKINSSTLNTYLYLGNYEKFLSSLPWNDSALVVFYHGFGSYYRHRYGEAASDFDRAYELAPDLLQAQVGRALSEGLAGRAGSGIAQLKHTENRMRERGVTDPEAMYKVAQAYALLGDRTDALRLFERSTAGGFFCFTYISRDPLMNSLRALPAFTQTLEQARVRQEHFQRRFGGKTP